MLPSISLALRIQQAIAELESWKRSWIVNSKSQAISSTSAQRQ